METGNVNFKEERDFGNTLNATFTFIKQEFKLLGKSIILYAGPFILIASLFSGWYQSSMFGGMKDLMKSNDILGFYANIFSWKYFVLILFSMLSNLMIVTTIFSYVILYTEKGKDGFTFEDVWEVIKDKFLTIFGTSLLLFLIYVPIALVSIIFLEIPFIYIAVAAVFVVFIKVYEGKSFGDSFSRSFYLVKNNWWKTFGLIVVAYIIVSFASAIFTIPSAIISMVYMFNAISTKAAQGPSVLLMVFTTIGTFCATLLYSVIHVAVVFQYYSLVESKDNPGLKDKIKKISGDGVSINN
jgi:hypothetical protein